MKFTRKYPESLGLRRLAPALGAFSAAVIGGAAGYWLIGDGKWPIDDCLYMAIVTLSTVGFAETLPGLESTPYARLWTSILILFGSGTLLYFASTLTAAIVEGDLHGAWKRNRMRKQIDSLTDHTIVCGIGATGLHVALELSHNSSPFVVIDNNQSRIDRLEDSIGNFPYILDDATSDHVLESAGISTAKGLVSSLTDDRDNLFVAVTARALNPQLRIISKCIQDDSAMKLRRAGADVVVSPSLIGGQRMATELLRPTALQFLDDILLDRDANRSIVEITVSEQSAVNGKTLADSNLRAYGEALVVAIRQADGKHVYNPPALHRLSSGQVLIVLLKSDQVVRLRGHLSG